jgi:hypothetical protein
MARSRSDRPRLRLAPRNPRERLFHSRCMPCAAPTNRSRRRRLPRMRRPCRRRPAQTRRPYRCRVRRRGRSLCQSAPRSLHNRLLGNGDRRSRRVPWWSNGRHPPLRQVRRRRRPHGPPRGPGSSLSRHRTGRHRVFCDPRGPFCLLKTGPERPCGFGRALSPLRQRRRQRLRTRRKVRR